MLTEQEGSSNMVYVTGDLHGDYSRFKRPEMKKLRAGDILLVCGDFGFIWDNSKQEQAVLKKLSEKKYTIAFVDGCHENFDLLQQYRLVRWRGGVARLIAPNIFHLQRGEIYTIENQKYFAFGGGHSQDYEYRRDTGNWWRQEQPTHDEIRRAIRNLNRNQATVDYIITHEPPASLKDCLGVDVQQRLEIHAFFEDIIKECDYKKWFFGKCHMDRFIPMKFYAVFQDVLPVTDERDLFARVCLAAKARFCFYGCSVGFHRPEQPFLFAGMAYFRTDSCILKCTGKPLCSRMLHSP